MLKSVQLIVIRLMSFGFCTILTARYLYLYCLEAHHFRPLAIGVQSPESLFIAVRQVWELRSLSVHMYIFYVQLFLMSFFFVHGSMELE